MWQEGERTSRGISVFVVLLLLAIPLWLALSFGPTAGAIALAWLLVITGTLVALGLLANGAVLVCLALIVKAFRSSFPHRGC